MAKEADENTQVTIVVPLRRLITGVPRTKRAPAAIPRIKKYVLRHIDPEWRDLIWDERKNTHRIWIDDFLNQTIWSRGRGHVGGPDEWLQPKEKGQRPRLTRRTTSRYGSILKVKVLLVKDREGTDPRVDVYLYGYEDKEADEAEEGHEGHDHAQGEGHDEEGGDGGEGEDEKPKAADAPKKSASTSAAAKGGKTAQAKGDAKKASPKKEGGD